MHNLIDKMSSKPNCSFTDVTNCTFSIQAPIYTYCRLTYDFPGCTVIITYTFFLFVVDSIFIILHICMMRRTRDEVEKNALKNRNGDDGTFSALRAAFCTRVGYKRIPWLACFPARLRQSV